MKSLRMLLLGGAVMPALATFALAQTSGSSAQAPIAGSSSNTTASGNGDATTRLSGAGLTGATDTTQRLQAFGGNGMMSAPGMNHMTARMQEMMHAWGMTPDMLRQARLMAHTTISRDDPATMLGLKGELKLTSAQVAKLKQIVQKAEVDARAVLSQKQETDLEKYPVEPTSMADMHQRMMASMKRRQQQAGAPTGRMTSPCALMDMLNAQQQPTSKTPQ